MKNTLRNELGFVRVSDEAIAAIAAQAANRVKGVSSMGSGGTVDSLADLMGVHSQSRGVHVEMGDREVALSLSILVEFGAEIAEVALQVQEAVAEAVEKMSGLTVVQVDVTVQGVSAANTAVMERKLR
jgi:uncharacterized alkaline shock family protein YloU